MQVFLNGSYIPAADAKVSVDDRGFLFADGVYEVARIYGGQIFLLDAHIERMRNGLRALNIRADSAEPVAEAAQTLVEENGVTGDGIVYAQITRGCAPRKHAYPSPDTACTVYVAARSIEPYAPSHFSNGVSAITVPDNRWARCDIKSISLLPNVMANQQAHEAGAFEALFVRDGVLIEGSHSNLFGVVDGTLTTYPACNYILPGITRALILQMAQALGIPAREGAIFVQDMPAISELFLSGTTTEVMPVVQLDGRPVGSGKPGPVTLKLQEEYRERAMARRATSGPGQLSSVTSST